LFFLFLPDLFRFSPFPDDHDQRKVFISARPRSAFFWPFSCFSIRLSIVVPIPISHTSCCAISISREAYFSPLNRWPLLLLLFPPSFSRLILRSSFPASPPSGARCSPVAAAFLTICAFFPAPCSPREGKQGSTSTPFHCHLPDPPPATLDAPPASPQAGLPPPLRVYEPLPLTGS